MTSLEIAEEVGASRSFAWVVAWPGWCRGDRDRLSLPTRLAAAAARYAPVAAEAGLAFAPDPDSLTAADFRLVETVAGSASTDFGVPGSVAELDREPLDAAAASRQASLVRAAWTVLDRVAAGAPAALRKGPRGGGRDRDKMIAHCVAADNGYAGQIGIRGREPAWDDRPAVEAQRFAILEIIGRPSDGGTLAGRKWTARYAARRIAWHSLDHAWEIEDKSDPAG
jgi:hypothetical protein